MGEIKRIAREKLVVGVLVGRPGDYNRLKGELLASFGPMDYESRAIPFVFTSYYDKEMGAPITRYFLSFKNLVAPESLSAIKLATNRLETGYADSGNRNINLDPGILNQSRFVLASTKDSSHRVPLPGGIFGEITLMYEHGGFRPVEWTYVDYRSPEYLKVLNEIRDIYRAQVKAGDHLGAY